MMLPSHSMSSATVLVMGISFLYKFNRKRSSTFMTMVVMFDLISTVMTMVVVFDLTSMVLGHFCCCFLFSMKNICPVFDLQFSWISSVGSCPLSKFFGGLFESSLLDKFYNPKPPWISLYFNARLVLCCWLNQIRLLLRVNLPSVHINSIVEKAATIFRQNLCSIGGSDDYHYF